MPVQQAEGKYMQFRYEPSYLEEDRHLQSDPAHVLAMNQVKAVFSDINLDGGNVLRWSDRVIVSDRVFEESPAYTDRSRLLTKLEGLLNAEVIVIPAIRSDMTGHADGMVRFYDRNTLIGNRLEGEYRYWQKGMENALTVHKLDYVALPSFEYKEKSFPDSAVGCYVNYLEIGDLILAPVFQVPGNKDEEAAATLCRVFADRQVEFVNINEIARQGGLLNCITWSIKA